jgi:glycerol-3-phosphate acyltransferase PlsX
VTGQATPRIVVDAMGGDYGVKVVVSGAVAAARQLGDSARIVCAGDAGQIEAQLERESAAGLAIQVVHAPENIGMDEAPAAAIRRKKDSSIVVGAGLLRDGEAEAFVSAGSTGAVTAASTLVIGRLPGVRRPGIAALIPTASGLTLLLDVGANSDAKPAHLLQFAGMGRIYSRSVLGVADPKVGILNIGEERGKGNDLTQEAWDLLDAHEPGFVGNIEGKHFFAGGADVVVCDGFTGNVVLKILESFGGFLASSFREEISGDWRAKLGAGILRPALKQYARRFNYVEYGGAPLLGCNGLVMISHGGSSWEAIRNAVLAADRGVRDEISRKIRDEIEREQQELDADPDGTTAMEGTPR